MTSERATSDDDAICRALARVIEERGWDRTTPALVAREAGVTVNDFYARFESLEHCYDVLYARTIARVTRVARRALVTTQPALGHAAWREQLEAVFRNVLWFFACEPALASACLVEAVPAGSAANARRDDALDRFTAYVEGLRLTHGEPVPPLAAEVIVRGTMALIQRRAAAGEVERLPELLPQLRRLWLTAPIAPPAPTGPAAAATVA